MNPYCVLIVWKVRNLFIDMYLLIFINIYVYIFIRLFFYILLKLQLFPFYLEKQEDHAKRSFFIKIANVTNEIMKLILSIFSNKSQVYIYILLFLDFGVGSENYKLLSYFVYFDARCFISVAIPQYVDNHFYRLYIELYIHKYEIQNLLHFILLCKFCKFSTVNLHIIIR